MAALRGILHAAATDDALAQRLVPVLALPTGVSSAGYPFLQQSAWKLFRDRVSHLLGMGQRALDACARLRDAVEASGATAEEKGTWSRRARWCGRSC